MVYYEYCEYFLYMKNTLPLIVITGPTASGKTTLAINLAKKIDAEIICADSRIVYKNLDIVSAKPTIKERDGIIHHLIDIKSLNEGIYSAGDFTYDAKNIIAKSKKPLIIQGGTWFYIKCLLDKENLFEFGKNEELRKKLSLLNNDELYEILKSKDENRANLIHKNNRDKIIRSIELIEAIGGELSKTKRPENENFSAVWFMRNFEREKLYERINLRVDLMLKEGLLAEFEQLKKTYGKNDILYNTIGYREFFDANLTGEASIKIIKDKIKTASRRYAKRQLTFFRSFKNVNWIHPDDRESLESL